jgi:hypothetical protein
MIAFDFLVLTYIGTPCYKRPRHVVVSRLDDSVMTIADKVEQLSPYTRDKRENIFQVVGFGMELDRPISDIEDIPKDTKLCFASFS